MKSKNYESFFLRCFFVLLRLTSWLICCHTFKKVFVFSSYLIIMMYILTQWNSYKKNVMSAITHFTYHIIIVVNQICIFFFHCRSDILLFHNYKTTDILTETRFTKNMIFKWYKDVIIIPCLIICCKNVLINKNVIHVIILL